MSFIEVILLGILFLYSVIIHEVSHGLMAQSMGDTTARDAGRLTLNPIRHIDLFGSIILPIGLFLVSHGSFVFGYAKPVPYNPMNLSDRRFGPAKVGFAGPLSNILLAVLFGLTLRFLPLPLQNPTLSMFLQYGVYFNLGLAIFNLIPIPPLDGHWLLLSILPDSFSAVRQYIVRYGIFFFFFVLILISYFDFITPLIRFLFRGIVGV